jgi:hypothetical protein
MTLRASFIRPFLALAVLTILAAGSAQAGEDMWAVTTSNNLINFNSDNPWTFNSRPITGLAGGEQVLGIDFRPAPPLGRLYAIGSTGTIYLISNPGLGAASAVPPGPGPMLSGSDFGFDFNPTVDRIRLISDADQNLRLNPNTGGVAATDSLLKHNSGPHFGADPQGTAAAYSNNNNGAMTTTLYVIDSGVDALCTQIPPNNGRLNNVGLLGIDVTGVNGFDISGATAIAYAALNTGSMQSSLYTVNLMTGAVSLAGVIGCAEPIRGLSVNNDVTVGAESRTWGEVKSLYGTGR